MTLGRRRALGCLIMAAIAVPGIACGGDDNNVSSPPTTATSNSSSRSQVAASHKLVVEAFYIPVCTTGPGVTPEGCERVDLDGVQVTVRDDNGSVVADASTGQDGTVNFEVPTGRYSVEGKPDSRARITPPPQDALVVDGRPVIVSLQYAIPQQ